MSNKRAATPDVAPIITLVPSLTKDIQFCSGNSFVNLAECRQYKSAIVTPSADWFLSSTRSRKSSIGSPFPKSAFVCTVVTDVLFSVDAASIKTATLDDNANICDSMGEIGTRRDLFKMAANLHIMSYPYSDTTYFFQNGGVFVSSSLCAISNMQLYRPPSPPPPTSFSETIPQHPTPPMMSNICVYNYINCFTHIAWLFRWRPAKRAPGQVTKRSIEIHLARLGRTHRPASNPLRTHLVPHGRTHLTSLVTTRTRLDCAEGQTRTRVVFFTLYINLSI